MATTATASDTQHTLLHFLSTKAPKLDPNPVSKSKTNTKDPRWQWPSRIVPWTDFNFTSLTQCCDGLFSLMLELPMTPMEFSHLRSKEGISFTAEGSLEKGYVSQWTFPIVKEALANAQPRCDRLIPPFVKMVAGEDSKAPGGHRHKPDWAGVRTSLPKESGRAVNILPGDTKVSYKWISSKVATGEMNENDRISDWAWPIRQIFTYCLDLRTRYGFIITDVEVVAFRVRAPRERFDVTSRRRTVSEDRGTLEIFPITNSTQGSAGSGRHMTMNLAVWWLHLLAANNRSIQNAAYPPLRNEILSGLVRPLDLGDWNGTPTVSEAAGPERGSPATTVRTVDNVISPQLSGYLAGPETSFVSMQSSTSTRSKRKMGVSEPRNGERNRKRARTMG
jgi:hypothetical protein